LFAVEADFDVREGDFREQFAEQQAALAGRRCV
jgi:hypothetical protein